MRQMTDLYEPTQDDLDAARDLRRALHRAPELSGEEKETADTIAAAMRDAGADVVLTGLGGHGVAAVFDGPEPGPTIMIRAELDALPIREETGADHASTREGVAHLCGHDGHMSILVTLARALRRRRPQSGRAILVFQPAEENGAGAAAMLDDPRFTALTADRVVSLHNLPGLDLGKVSLAEGPFATASRGLRVRLEGTAAHASQPQDGLSPAPVVVRLMQSLPAMASHHPFPSDEFALATLTHVSLGATAFGVAPGGAVVQTTLRTLHDDRMDDLAARAETEAREAAETYGLDCEIEYDEVFSACSNHPDAVADLRAAFDDLGIDHSPEGQPWRPAEDFGRFGEIAPAAMFFLGSGAEQPPLHSSRFDFPDELIAHGTRIFGKVLQRALG